MQVSQFETIGTKMGSCIIITVTAQKTESKTPKSKLPKVKTPKPKKPKSKTPHAKIPKLFFSVKKQKTC